MHDHYYTAAPQSAHRFSEASYVYREQTLTFVTDAGVFSKGEVDVGTDLLLRSLPEKLSGRVLDLGCGWGVIGISIGLVFPACEIVMSDVNERAVGLARKNAEANGVPAQTVCSDGFNAIEGTFDLIVTNPPIRAGKEVIYGLFASAAARLREQGQLWLVIRKQQGAESALKYLRTIFQTADVIRKSGGFWVICCEGGTHAV